MLSGKFQGQLLRMLSQLIRPKMILEIGTFTGYASLCLAEGLATGGVLHTIEANEELAPIIQKYIQKMGFTARIQLHIGDAKAIVPTLQLPFDLVFIDAGKQDNGYYYDLLIEQLPIGAILLTDNVLWKGKVVEPPFDKLTKAIHDFNQKIQIDPRVENIILPIRDGVLVARKC